MNKASERQARYDEKNCIGLYLKLNKKYDADILDWLAEQGNKQGAIKALIRESIDANVVPSVACPAETAGNQ